MHDVLRVVEHNGLRLPRGCAFMRDERVVEMVEAIGLGRGAIGRHLDGLDTVILDARNGGCGGRIVAIVTDEDPVIGIVETLQGRPEH
jgi:hypothetical protein